MPKSIECKSGFWLARAFREKLTGQITWLQTYRKDKKPPGAGNILFADGYSQGKAQVARIEYILGALPTSGYYQLKIFGFQWRDSFYKNFVNAEDAKHAAQKIVDELEELHASGRVDVALAKQGLVAPTVNINGTARSDLVQGYMAALEALRVLRLKLIESGPHGAAPHSRDYPSTEDFSQAVSRLRSWSAALDTIDRDLTTIAEAVATRPNNQK